MSNPIPWHPTPDTPLPAVTADAKPPGRWRSGRNRNSGGKAGLGPDPTKLGILPAAAPVPLWVWGGVLGLIFWGAFTPNFLLTFGGALVLPLLFKLLWRQGEVPLLLFSCFFQWLQVVVPLIIANYYGQTLEAHFGIPLRSEATWLGLMGVAVFAVGLRLALSGCVRSIGPTVEKEVAGFSIQRLLLAWGVALGVAIPIEIICRLIPGLAQILIPISWFKTGIVFLLGYAVVRQQRGYAVFDLVIVAEFAMGTLGFFSGFKVVFIVLLLLLITTTREWNLRVALIYLALVAAAFASGTVWSAIKPGYRDFLNQGSGQQEVVVPVAQRLDYLATNIRAMDEAEFSDGFETTLERIGYTQFFADTLMKVPLEVPYEHGRLWWDAVSRPFMPRLLFPDKLAANDSDRTRKYATPDVAGVEEGTSIGLGYMAESYVDFGPVFMFVPIFLLAQLFGLAFRYFVLRPGMGAWGYVIAFAMPFASTSTFESSNIKLVGPVISCAIMFWPLDHYFGESIKAWLRGGAAPSPRQSRRKRRLGQGAGTRSLEPEL